MEFKKISKCVDRCSTWELQEMLFPTDFSKVKENDNHIMVTDIW